MENRQSSLSTSDGAAAQRDRAGRALILFAVFTLPSNLLCIALFDNFMAHYKRFPLYLALNLLFVIGVRYSVRRGCCAKSCPLSRGRIALLTLLYGAGGLVLLLALERLFPPFLVFFQTGWLLLFYPLLLHWLRPSKFAAGLALSTGLTVLLLFGAETVFLFVDGRPRAKSLPDYSDLFSGAFHPGGELQPGQNVRAWSYTGPVEWITNSAGFRNAAEFPLQKPAGTFRVIYAGDSFVAGYRTDQADFSGAVLQRELTRLDTQNKKSNSAEVLVAAVEEQASLLFWLRKFGVSYQPDLLVAGVCLGNDIAQCHVFVHPGSMFDMRQTSGSLQLSKNRETPAVGFNTPPFADALLPPQAYRPQNPLYRRMIWPLLSAWRKSHLGWRALNFYWLCRDPGIHSMYGDEPNRVHLFDNGHGLGFYYQPVPEPVERAWRDWETVMSGLQRECHEHGVRLGIVLIPQRFVVEPEDWAAAARRFALDPARFELDYPARRIRMFCEQNDIAVLDLTEMLRQTAREEKQRIYLPLGDMHWNSVGQLAAGAAIAKWIETQFRK